MTMATVIVLARHDPHEAMRVAAGITIMDHHVRLLALIPLPDSPKMHHNLALAGVTVEDATPAALAQALADADHVVCL